MSHGSKGVALLERCPQCKGQMVTIIRQRGPVDPFTNRYGVEFTRAIHHGVKCILCDHWSTGPKVFHKPKDRPPVRQEIVEAIRKLKTKGWKFPWDR